MPQGHQITEKQYEFRMANGSILLFKDVPHNTRYFCDHAIKDPEPHMQGQQCSRMWMLEDMETESIQRLLLAEDHSYAYYTCEDDWHRIVHPERK